MTTLLEHPSPSPRSPDQPVDPNVLDPTADTAVCSPSRRVRAAQLALTGLLVLGPPIALGITVPLAWGSVIHLHDVIVGAVLYLVTGFGIAIGYHRLLTHRSFTPNRPLKIALAVAGSLAVEGSAIGWVAGHRRHHRFSDRAGDPHSPHRYGHGVRRQLRGFVHAHMGWLFTADPTSSAKYAQDLEADKDIAAVSRWFPALAIASFALPFGIGWVVSGTIWGALGTLLWAGAARVMLLHHVTWSINSICHMFGKRPFRTRDESRNFAPLALVSFGESWHNLHHAWPAAARHGALRGQVDVSAGLIRLFEKLGWAKDVRWPDPERLLALRAVPVARATAG